MFFSAGWLRMIWFSFFEEFTIKWLSDSIVRIKACRIGTGMLSVFENKCPQLANFAFSAGLLMNKFIQMLYIRRKNPEKMLI